MDGEGTFTRSFYLDSANCLVEHGKSVDEWGSCSGTFLLLSQTLDAVLSEASFSLALVLFVER